VEGAGRNKGGLLPCYFQLSDESWIKHYRWALRWKHERDWEPSSYGLWADRWPRPGKGLAVLLDGEQPQLRLAAVDGELLDREA
jgi:hypothetical protein